ncbi:hypothetical protein EUGRSUZ_L02811 [Eucalyptus grandis]|uniref:Uncharacterized protein n=1 Tax=Eucalyptus grandis TaxID=71139 RepID=A0AAD9T932_EUCGR|nr:hypothetical protein EUGRSUZ_L02811 [Eucalyptus grandis]
MMLVGSPLFPFVWVVLYLVFPWVFQLLLLLVPVHPAAAFIWLYPGVVGLYFCPPFSFIIGLLSALAALFVSLLLAACYSVSYIFLCSSGWHPSTRVVL